jgi:hypothetical protein
MRSGRQAGGMLEREGLSVSHSRTQETVIAPAHRSAPTKDDV